MERTANVPEDLTGRPRRVATGGVSWRNTFSAFQYRNYRLYFCGQLVSLIGTWMTNTAQGWLVYQLTGSKALLGIVAAAGTAPMLFFAAWGGWAADRFPKRSVLLWTQSAMMILAFIFAGLVWVGPHPPMGDYCPWLVWRRRDGFRHARPAVVCRRDRQPRGLDECDLAQ